MNSKFLISAVMVSAVGALWAAEDKAPAASSEKQPELVEQKNDVGRWYVSPGAGVIVMDNNLGNNAAPFVSLKLGYDLNDYFSLEAGMMYSPSAPTKDDHGDQLAGPVADVLFHMLGKKYRFDPYLTAGVAYWFSNGRDFGEITDQRADSLIAPRLGIGLGYRLTDNLELRAEGKSGIQLVDSSIRRSFVETVELGLLYRFGGSEGEGACASDAVVPAEPVKPEAPAYNQKLEKDYKGIVKDATPEGAKDVMILELYINFDWDQTVIKPQYYDGLNEIARVIRKAVAKNPNVTVSVEGHADRRYKSSRTYNQRLSERRADVVKSYIVNTGVDGSKLSTVGYGFDRPKGKVDLVNGNPEDRRVDIFIHGVGDQASRDDLRKSN